MTGRPTVFVVDDDESVLRGLGRLLRSAGYAVEPFRAAPELLARAPVDEPGCVLVDLRMPGMTGLELQEALRAAGVALPLVFVSGASDVPAAAQAFKAGAVDFLTKPFDEATVLAAVRMALARDEARRMAAARRAVVAAQFETLTPREREVCLLVAEGLLNKQIGWQLGTTEKTVKVHRARGMEKLGAGSVAELVRLVDEWRGRAGDGGSGAAGAR